MRRQLHRGRVSEVIIEAAADDRVKRTEPVEDISVFEETLNRVMEVDESNLLGPTLLDESLQSTVRKG